ncbi:MAG: TetR/AcrR family transcriptional regulator [Prochloraceae cyanobacterium]
MPRKIEFDPHEVLRKAISTFWKNGFQATSIGDLEKEIGISRFSIYNTFGDKEGLLLACLELYTRLTREMLEQKLNGGIEAIEKFLQSFALADRGADESCYGCLVVNTILESPRMSQQVRGKIKVYRQTVKQALYDALLYSQQRGELRENLDLSDCADYLLSAISGLVITNRWEQDKRASEKPVRVLLALLNSWKTQKSS